MPNNPDMNAGAPHHRADLKIVPGTTMYTDLTLPLKPKATQLARSSGLRDRLGKLAKRTLDIALAIPVVLFVLPPLCLIVKLSQVM